jgi:hypothetical protein
MARSLLRSMVLGVALSWLSLIVQSVHAAALPSSLPIPATGKLSIQCPVCEQQLDNASPYAQFNKNQFLRACTDIHMEKLLTKLPEYLRTSEHRHEKSESEGSICPLCGMEGSHTNAIDFVGNQALFLCPMETQSSKNKLLSSPSDYISKNHTERGEVCK